MTDYAKIIDNLRNEPNYQNLWIYEAADELEAQARRIADLSKEADMMHSEYKTAAARIAELEAALKPFADLADEWGVTEGDERFSIQAYVFPDELRAARAALEEK